MFITKVEGNYWLLLWTLQKPSILLIGSNSGRSKRAVACLMNIIIRLLKAMYSGTKSCVRWDHVTSEFLYCPIGVKQGALESSSIVSLYINVVADYVRQFGKHGVQLLPCTAELFFLLCADDIILLSTTPVGPQNQLSSLILVSSTLGLCANTDKTNVTIFRSGGHLSLDE